MIQRLNGFFVALNDVIVAELRPTRILHYLNEQVIERASVMLYGCTAVVPRTAMN